MWSGAFCARAHSAFTNEKWRISSWASICGQHRLQHHLLKAAAFRLEPIQMFHCRDTFICHLSDCRHCAHLLFALSRARPPSNRPMLQHICMFHSLHVIRAIHLHSQVRRAKSHRANTKFYREQQQQRYGSAYGFYFPIGLWQICTVCKQIAFASAFSLYCVSGSQPICP